jgi:hypothetical protein
MPKEIDAITKLYDYLLYIIPVLEKFPRSQKFLIGDRIETLLLDTLELLINAAYSKRKYGTLKTVNLKLETLRYLLRLSKDLKLITPKGYEFSARAVNDIGVSVGGWLKYAKREEIRQPVQ